MLPKISEDQQPNMHQRHLFSDAVWSVGKASGNPYFSILPLLFDIKIGSAATICLHLPILPLLYDDKNFYLIHFIISAFSYAPHFDGTYKMCRHFLSLSRLPHHII
jgi:hypothetical protein